MYPILLDLGPIKLYAYGLLMALGFFFAINWSAQRATRYKVSREFISNVGIWIIVGGIVGGRVAFLAVEETWTDIFTFKLFEVWNGGMVFYGGLVCAILASWGYCKRKGVEFITLADIAAPTIAFGQIFGRLGCFMAGCCYGKQCDLPWAVSFTHPLSLAPKNVYLHPTQLYEPLGNLLVIAIILLIERKFATRQKGLIFVTYLSLYAIVRVTVEAFRGDSERGFVTFWDMYPNEWLSTSTAISAVMLLISAIIFWMYRGRPSPSSSR